MTMSERLDDTFKESLKNQFAAAFATIQECMKQCDDDSWTMPICNLTFSQATFHALFYADVYLGPDLASLREQTFHLQNADWFGDYEELQDKAQTNQYEKSDILKYIDHCRAKADLVLDSETPQSLAKTPGFDWLDFSRAEVHVYNLRHLYHHAAQLSLQLRLKTGEGVKWVRSGP